MDIDKEKIKQQYKQFKHLLEPILSKRYLDLFEFRWGLLDGTTHTLEECGEKLNVTRERIRQMEARVLYELDKLTGIDS